MQNMLHADLNNHDVRPTQDSSEQTAAVLLLCNIGMKRIVSKLLLPLQ